MKLNPLDWQSRHNLEFALQQAGIHSAGPGLSTRAVLAGFNDWLANLPARLWLIVLALGWLGIGGVLVLRQFKSDVRVRYLAVPALVLIFAVTGGLAYQAKTSSGLPTAVAISADVPVYQGNSAAFPSVTNLHLSEGDSVEILQQRGDWWQIRNAQGQQGWTSAEHLEAV